MLRFGERITLFFFRPLYRTFVERLVWWFLTKVKIFFVADMAAQVDSIDRRLREEDHSKRWAAIDQRLRSLEQANAAQWSAIEQLLLAMFQSSELPALDPDGRDSALQGDAVASRVELTEANGRNHLR